MKIIYSADRNFIDKQINLINQPKVNLFFSDNFDEIRNEIQSCSLFGNDHLYIVRNCHFLEKLDVIAEVFLEEMKDENVILTFEGKKIDTKKITSIPGIEVVFLTELNNYTMKQYIDNLLKSYGIFKIDKEFLYSLLIPNSSIIDHEVMKLEALKNEHLNRELLAEIIFDYSKENIFDLILFLFNKDYLNLFKTLDNLIFKGYSVEHIIAILATQMFNLKLYCIRYEKDGNLVSLASFFKIEEYKIKKYFLIIQNNHSSKITSILDKMLICEIKIKQGAIDAYLAIRKLFLEI
ncbi:MAG: DNA polymerase III subunit delta [Mycoplasmoidaceae bacterium]